MKFLKRVMLYYHKIVKETEKYVETNYYFFISLIENVANMMKYLKIFNI